MHRLVAVLSLALLVMLSRPAAASDIWSASADWTRVDAAQDFDAVRSEMGLSGSAPLFGLEPLPTLSLDEGAARSDFEAVYTELGLSGSAPLAGLEAYELTVRPAVAYSPFAAVAEASSGGR